jgi:TusA-related sulfurtransferase
MRLSAELARTVLDDDGREYEVHEYLDVRGLVCPAPALNSLEATAALKPGQVLEITGDWLESKFEVPSAILRTGFVILAIHEDDDSDLWKIYVKRER